MPLFSPSEDDKQYEKKPRFLQDALAYIIMGVVGLGVILYLVISSS